MGQHLSADRYPQLASLRRLADGGALAAAVLAGADEFERSLDAARQLIPTVNLGDVFPPALESAPIRLEHFLGHWGNISIEELCKISLIVSWLRPKRILEIGTFNGMTTLQMALNAPSDSVVYTIDLPEEALAEAALSDVDSLVANQARQSHGTSTGSYFRGRSDVRIVQLLGDSSTFDFAAAIDGAVDIVFIDGAHDLEHKRRDSETAFSLLAPGGVVLWHNYADVVNPDVTRHLAELARDRRISHLRNTYLAVYRDGA